MDRKEKIGYSLIASSAIIYGLMPLMVIVLERAGVNTYTVTAAKNWFSIPLLFLLCLRRRDGFVQINTKLLPLIVLAAILSNIATPLLLYASYFHISSGTATTLHFIYPVVVVIGCAVLYGKKISSVQLVCILLGLTGIVLFYFPTGKGESGSLIGILLALASGVTYAGYIIVIGSEKLKQIPALQLTFYISLVCSIFLIVSTVFIGGISLPSGWISWLIFILLSIASGVLCLLLFQKGVQLIGPLRAAILSTLEPMTSIVIGAMFFNEKLDLYAWLGCTAILASVIILILKDRET